MMNVRLNNKQIQKLATHIANKNIDNDLTVLMYDIDNTINIMLVLTDLFDTEAFEKLVLHEYSIIKHEEHY